MRSMRNIYFRPSLFIDGLIRTMVESHQVQRSPLIEIVFNNLFFSLELFRVLQSGASVAALRYRLRTQRLHRPRLQARYFLFTPFAIIFYLDQDELHSDKNLLFLVWANNGDYISRQYAGPSALKVDFTSYPSSSSSSSFHLCL